MSAPASWRFEAFELHPVERRLVRDGKVVSMPPKAFDLLAVLVKNSGRLVRRQDLLDTVWSGVEMEDANLTNNITALRRDLLRHSIDSVPKYGYRFCLPVSASVGLSPGRFSSVLGSANVAFAALNGIRAPLARPVVVSHCSRAAVCTGLGLAGTGF